MPNVKLWPAVSVMGSVSPLTVKAAPVTVALEIVTLVPPGFFKVSERSWLLPICTLPKLTLDGVAETLPGAVTVAVRGIFNVAFEALLLIATLPVAVPAVVGARVTFSVAVCPAINVRGVVMPLIV